MARPLTRLLFAACVLSAPAAAQVPTVPRASVPSNPALDSAGPVLSLSNALLLAQGHNPTYLQSGVARKTASAVLRAAYGQGYCDAMREPEAGALCRELGLTSQPE